MDNETVRPWMYQDYLTVSSATCPPIIHQSSIDIPNRLPTPLVRNGMRGFSENARTRCKIAQPIQQLQSC
jgi:hypothetical protein